MSNSAPAAPDRRAMAARLQALLDIPVDLLLGDPGDVLGPEAVGLLEVDPYLAVRARQLMATVMHAPAAGLAAVPVLATLPGLGRTDLVPAA